MGQLPSMPSRCHCGRHYSPALALTLLDPKLDFGEAETAAGTQSGTVVGRADGSGISPHDLRRLQVGARTPDSCSGRRRLLFGWQHCEATPPHHVPA